MPRNSHIVFFFFDCQMKDLSCPFSSLSQKTELVPSNELVASGFWLSFIQYTEAYKIFIALDL